MAPPNKTKKAPPPLASVSLLDAERGERQFAEGLDGVTFVDEDGNEVQPTPAPAEDDDDGDAEG